MYSMYGQASAIPSAQAQMSRPKTRSACNRCHQQKLRCIKVKGHNRCERCANLKAECLYSPRERRATQSRPSRKGPAAWLRPSGLVPAAVPAMSDMRQTGIPVPENAECDWSSFQPVEMSGAEGLGYHYPDPKLPMGISQPVLCSSGQIAEPLNTHPLSHGHEMALNTTPTPIHQDAMGGVEIGHSLDFLDRCHFGDYNNYTSFGKIRTLTSTTARLTSLNMALYECASKLSSIIPSQAVGDPCIILDREARRAALFSLDEVFRVTNQLIDVMGDLLPTTMDCHESSSFQTATRAITISPCLLQRPDSAFKPRPEPPMLEFEPWLEAEEMPSSSGADDPFSHLDEATMLLFLSCHCRLAKIYESIFEAMKRCIKGSPAAFPSTAGILLPQLHVGGLGGVSSPALCVDFSEPPLPRATISMYMALVTMMSAQLWTQMAEALRQRRVCHESSDQAHTTHLGGAAPSWDVTMKRIDNMSRTISSVQRLL
ncbi:hypothetical protein F5Y14DRAFT_135125 [Nemania sp. NC0429]|nr:hypothetical protein F5Y14DRAFT_135125 [Nemania sp. NC0429]